MTLIQIARQAVIPANRKNINDHKPLACALMDALLKKAND